MKVLSVNVGSLSPLFGDQPGARRILTGIFKQPVQGPVAVGRLGLAGDEQADLTIHGGLRKAVYAYPGEHYPFWQAQRSAALRREEALAPGAMGENLTLQGLSENQVWLGDRLQIGSTLLEVTEPRQPCFKFNARMGFGHAMKSMLQSGHTGFYMRVLETGAIMAGDAVTLIPGPRETSIAQVNERRWRGRQRDLF